MRDGGPPGDGVGVFVEAAEEGLVVDDVPEAVLDFFEPDVFVIERLAQEVLAVELLPMSKEAWAGAYRVEDLARIYAMVGEYDAAID